MKKILTFISTLTLLLAASVSTSLPAYAVTDVSEGLTIENLNEFNPLVQFSTPGNYNQLSTPGGIMSRVLTFAFPIAGMILFVMLVWAGFEILAGASNKKSMDAGKQRATTALGGFFLLFCSYWLAQIIEAIFKVTIL